MMWFPRNIPIRRKLTLVVLVSSAAALLVVSVALFAFQVYTFRQNFTHDVGLAADIISANSVAALEFDDGNAARDILAGLNRQEFTSAYIVKSNGKVLARFGQDDGSVPFTEYPTKPGYRFRGGDLLQMEEIRLDNAKLGTLYLRSDYGRLYASARDLFLGTLAVVLALSSGIAFAISSQLQRVISVPIQKLAETARVIAAENDYSLRAEKMEADEIGAFTDTFNHMLEQIQYQDATLQAVQNTLERQVTELQHEIAERKRAEEEVEVLHNQLVEASRHAGMAEVATGVLHNVGNVLNSVNVSSTLLSDRLRKSRASNVVRAADLLKERNGDLATWLATDERGKMLPNYLAELGKHLATEHADMTAELELLVKNVEHIKEIVAMQQNYAKVSGFTESLPVEKLMEDAIQMNAAAFDRHRVRVIRNYDNVPNVRVDKHKVLQILVNLLRNAKYAMDSNPGERRLDLTIQKTGEENVRVIVRDTGCGIPKENLTRIFSHGFTTKKDGHGFGLHSGALAAQEMGGILTAESEGQGRGATFILDLPISEPIPT
ncbi:MAG TPA: ATP-binding protein [Chthoniobacteraceae bacterium]|jgi:C4-dicarboxylate-specific signal transduction histidine kinase|nr:ATP-binding protein [Chthoniobacteraceae bacterium]